MVEKIKYWIKNTKINGFLITDILLIIIIGFLVLVTIPFTRKYTTINLFCGLLFSALMFCLLSLYGGKTYLKNKSKKKVYVKCENDDNVFELGENEHKTYIDGFCVDGVVYKLCDGCKSYVKKNGSVSFGSIFSAESLGSYVLNSCPNDEWKPLFNVAETYKD